ncbi:hypothetical protein F5876DRAFT_82960 [Lentinula aff. lateritia]|uniref:Uncharacterized protein n=1 Tax=Lentinula aff. lateritia TaxID=2804960 RepID=A0ACC1TIN2_9AGAR|nr:hypothetical protein F5876DRAFT_82960 [Lentinula aff. lateritia]
MSTVPTAAVSDPHPIASTTPTPLPLPHPPLTTEEVNVDELASTMEDPPLGQLTLFKSVFGVGVSLARYIVDDPLWPILAAAGLPCSFCVRSKKSGSCSVVPHLAHCSNCDNKKPCILGRLARFRYFAHKYSHDLSFARRFLEAHGDPGQHTRFSLLPEQWRTIADKIESSTSSTRALLELSPLDDQDWLEEDHLALQDLIRHQPKLSAVVGPVPSGPHSPLVPDEVFSLPKKRKRTVRVGEASSLKRKCSVEQDPGVDKASNYCRVVLVLPPQVVSCPEVIEPRTPSRGDPANKASLPLPSPGVPLPLPPRADTSYGGRTTQSGSFGQFVPPTLTATVPRDQIKSPPFLQRNREALHPYPRSQVNTSLKAENDSLKSEVAELRRLLEELESSRQALQEVSADRAEYQRVLTQFRAIDAELPDLPSEDVLTRFFIAQSEVGSYREVAVKQKQEIAQLRQQVADVDKHSSKAHEELDVANTRAMRLRDRLEELEESVHHYRSCAHIVEGLIHQYSEDKGLYKIDLPSLSSMQDKLNESEVLVRRLATFAHQLYTADPANPLHYHNMYVGGLLEAGRFTHGELHLRSLSSLLYYYSNAADRVNGLYQEHAGYVDARPGSLEPPLHRLLFSFGHPIPLPQSPLSDHIPAVPSMDSIMLDWECKIAGYVSEVLGYPVPSFAIPSALGVSHTSDPDASTAHASIPEPSSVLGATTPPPPETPLFLPESLSPPSPHSPSLIPSSAPLPNVPREVVDLTMEDDDELYESWEEFLVRMGGAPEIKQESSDPSVV